MQVDRRLQRLRHVIRRDLLNDFAQIDRCGLPVGRLTAVGARQFQQLNEQPLQAIGRLLNVLE